MKASWLRRLFSAPIPALQQRSTIPDRLWTTQLAALPFIAARDPSIHERLRTLCERFLASKEFHGAQGLAVSDEMALSVAMQACLPLSTMPTGSSAHSLLAWYDDFVGIVLQPGEVVAPRNITDDSGVVHEWQEVIAGEAMELGPVMLNWNDVAQAGESAADGYNVVVHEFLHKMDLRDGVADGCPPLPSGFCGAGSYRQARQCWAAVFEPAYQRFRERVIRAERFGSPAPWLDAYGAESPDEFFAVTGEAYFVNRRRFDEEFPELAQLYDAFFAATVSPPDQR